MNPETPPHPVKASAFLIAPRRGRHRAWFHRRRSSSRGRFELALIGGGLIALALAAILPGQSTGMKGLTLVVACCAMTYVARLVGLAPSLAVTAFSPLVIALTDPMWTLGSTIADFTMAEESEAVFATFLIATLLGGALRRGARASGHSGARPLWSAKPFRETTGSEESVVRER